MKVKQKIQFKPSYSKILLLLLVYTYPTLYAQPSMVPVIGGTFIMGCTIEQEAECSDSEKPAHDVAFKTLIGQGCNENLITKFDVTKQNSI